MTPRAVLIGLPGVGKSTTGRRLAKILAVPFADSDHLIEAQEGRAVAEIFAGVGEAGFRAIEARVIASAVTDYDGVLALGGGALSTETTRELLVAAAVSVVHLRARIGTLSSRVGDGSSRPLLSDDPEARLRELAEQRLPIFIQAATCTVDTDGRMPGQVAATIAARLHEAGVL